MNKYAVLPKQDKMTKKWSIVFMHQKDRDAFEKYVASKDGLVLELSIDTKDLTRIKIDENSIISTE